MYSTAMDTMKLAAVGALCLLLIELRSDYGIFIPMDIILKKRRIVHKSCQLLVDSIIREKHLYNQIMIH